MTILLSGGTGLVGSRLLRRFVDAGMDCRALVRPGKQFSPGRRSWKAIFSMRIR
jgi:UDP-glucose 4-epimerase